MAEHMAEWGMTSISEKYDDITLHFRTRTSVNKKTDGNKNTTPNTAIKKNKDIQTNIRK